MRRRTPILLGLLLATGLASGCGDTVAPNITSSDVTADTALPPEDTTPSPEDTASPPRDTAVGQDTTPPPEPEGRLAPGVQIDAIELYQTVQIPWMSAGELVASSVPVIAGRDTLVRVYVSPLDAGSGVEVTAEVTLSGSDLRYESPATAVLASSTLNVVVPGAELLPGATMSVQLTVASGGEEEGASGHPAMWPSTGSAALGVTEASGPLQIRLIPLRDDRGGVGRLPDTSPEQLALFEDLLRALYPATDVQIEVHEVIGWSSALDFGDINSFLVQLKDDENAPDAMYYYAVIRPAETFADYCFGTCTTGQSFTVRDGASGIYRVGSGVGFPGERWAWTLAHELGHMHGRGHAPCDVSWWSDDDNYPYPGGVIGVRGWDARDGSLRAPDVDTDVMGYCDVQWMSDYTYLGIFERARAIQPGPGQLLSLPPPRKPYRALMLSETGARWGRMLELGRAQTGAKVGIQALSARGDVLETSQAGVIDSAHGAEQMVLVPWPLAAGASSLNIAGRMVRVDRR